MDYIAAYKDRFGVEPIVEVLNEHGITFALSTYYEHAARGFGPTAAALADAYAANEAPPAVDTEPAALWPAQAVEDHPARRRCGRCAA